MPPAAGFGGALGGAGAGVGGAGVGVGIVGAAVGASIQRCVAGFHTRPALGAGPGGPLPTCPGSVAFTADSIAVTVYTPPGAIASVMSFISAFV